MALTQCVDCGRRVSTEAGACPGCGRPQHAQPSSPAAYDWTPRRKATAVAVILGAIVFVIASSLEQIRADRTPKAAPPAVPPAHRTATPSAPSPAVPVGYQTLIANVWIGKQLYLKSDLKHIGEVIDIADAHRFDDGTTRQAVLVRFANGGVDWIPRNTAQRIYVTK